MNKLIIILLVVFYSMINASIAMAEEESLGQYLYKNPDWVKYNNIYQGFVGEDLKTCSSAYPVFEKLIVKYGEQLK